MTESPITVPELAVASILLFLLVASLLGGPVRTVLLVFLGWRLTRLLALPALGVGLFMWLR